MEYCVNTKTQQEYNELMDIIDKQGKKWCDGVGLKEYNGWTAYYEKTIICIQDTIARNSTTFTQNAYISLEEYKKQIVNSEKPKIAEQTEEIFTLGEWVEVSSDKKNWEDIIFLVEIEGALFPYFCINDRWEENYKEEEDFGVTAWRFIRKKKQVTNIFDEKYSTEKLQEAIKDLTTIE